MDPDGQQWQTLFETEYTTLQNGQADFTTINDLICPLVLMLSTTAVTDVGTATSVITLTIRAIHGTPAPTVDVNLSVLGFV